MDYNEFKKLPIDEAIKYAAAYTKGFTPEDIRGVWGTESAFGQNKGPSKAGAIGDFQIMPNTQTALEQRFGRKFDPTDFHDSLYMGAEVLRENLAHFGTKQKALKAYNGGWDESKWDNPETAAYADKVLGGSAQSRLVDNFVASKDLPSFLRSQARMAAIAESGVADPKDAGVLSDQFNALYMPEVPEAPMYDEDARRLANEQQHAGFGESFVDSMVYNSVTGKLVDIWNRGQDDPNFNSASDDNKARIQAAGVYDNDDMTHYILGAKNEDDFSHRLEVAQERVALQRRIANTPGLGAEAGAFIGSMADPVGVAASIGMGAAAAAARGAAAAGRARMIARAAAGGAAENVIIGMGMTTADNQRLRWSQVLTDATLGGALGTLGGLVVRSDGRLAADPNVHVDPAFAPMLDGARRSVEDTVAGANARAYEQGMTTDHTTAPGPYDGPISTQASDMPTVDLGLSGRDPVIRVQAEDGSVRYDNIPEERTYYPADAYNSRLGYKPEPTLGNATYRGLHDQGVLTELRTAADLNEVSHYQRKYGQPIPDDAKAVYIPQDDRVYLFRDRLTQQDIDNPMGLVMHEVGVHYGLERTVGTETYNRILQDITKSNDARIKSALKVVPSDTPEHLKLEEAVGYLAEKHPDLPIVKRLIATIRNWLRENVNMFKNMEVSVDDALAYIRGTVDHVRKEGKLSSNLTFPYVWHGSAVKGIESLDLKYAGTGEGRSAFGYGHYVTSEKGTAMDYRNKEAKRRGMNEEDGGLYRLKVNADPEQMLDWDGAVPDQIRAAFPEVDLGRSGATAYDALTKAAGSQKAASEALAKAGVPGIKYKSGRSRADTIANHNYVLFSNEALSMEARYSRNTAPDEFHGLELNAREKAIAAHVKAVNDVVDPNSKQQIERTQKWLASVPDWMKKSAKWATSPGVAMSMSPNEYARKTGAMFFENTLGSDGRPSKGTVAMDYERLHRGYRDPALQRVKQELPALMSTSEKLDSMMGGTKGLQRISTLVAEERLRHRMHLQQGKKYVSSAPEGIQRLAKIADDQMFRMVDDGKDAGSAYAQSVFGSGVVGFMPQVWNWRKLQAAQVENPQHWEAVKKNFKQQYIEKQVDPILKKMQDAGPQQPDVMTALRDRLLKQVDYQVNTRMMESIRDPNSRTSQDSGKFETMAAQLLEENWHGETINADVIDGFKNLLKDHINDRTRTEFDMLREVDGVRLLDYLEHDLVSTISHTAHRFAGQTAMAKRGFKDYADFEALINVLHASGARPLDIELTLFAGRAFGFQPMIVGDNAAVATLRNFTYSAMLGKLGIAQMADLANTVTALGIKELPHLIGRGLSKETPVYKQLVEMYGNGLTGTDYRIQSFIADVQPNGRALGGMGNRLLKLSQRSAQLVSWINGSNFVNHALHKAFLPIMLENLVRAARGLDGGMNPARLADAGLSADTLARIKTQLDKYEPNRKEGDAFNWDSWDDQYAADRMIEAMHRVTGQVFQRTLIGEAAMWRTESAIGSLLGQFHNYGMTAMEKQLGRNLAINDMNTYTAIGLGMTWSALLYYGRLQVNTAGMDKDKAQEYIDKNTTPMRLTQGMLTYFNMSGITADLMGVGEAVFGGAQYQGGSGPVAAVGYMNNFTRSLGAVGNLLQGSEDPGKDVGTILKIVPGGNSAPGTWAINSLRE